MIMAKYEIFVDDDISEIMTLIIEILTDREIL